MERKRPVGVLAVVGAALFCLPCLIPLVLVGAAAVGFATIGAWFADNAVVLVAAGSAAAAAGGLAGLRYLRRRGGAACEIDPGEGDVGTAAKCSASSRVAEGPPASGVKSGVGR